MSAVLTYTKSASLFELHNGRSADYSSNDSDPEERPEDEGLPGHNRALLRQLSDGRNRGRARPRGPTAISNNGTDRCRGRDGSGPGYRVDFAHADTHTPLLRVRFWERLHPTVVYERAAHGRFGPGRQLKRRQQIKRLRELRASRCGSWAHDSADRNPMTRDSRRGGGRLVFERQRDEKVDVRSRNRKRRRASPREANQVPTQKSLPERAAVDTAESTGQQQNEPSLRATAEVTYNEAERYISRKDGRPKSARNHRVRDDTGMNAVPASSSQTLGEPNGDERLSRLDVSVAPSGPLNPLDEGTRSDSCSSYYCGTGGLLKTTGLTQIFPIRSGPVPWRPRTGGSEHLLLLNDDKFQQRPPPRKQKEHSSDDEAAVMASAAEGRGNKHADDLEISLAGSNSDGIEGAHEDTMREFPVASLADWKSGQLAIPDACGGIVLRMTPAERSLEPWGTELAAIRAMCDVEPSLSRAGTEYRGVIHAVDGAREMKFYHTLKKRKARDAKSFVGQDMRPRTSEPRLRIAGVTTELDVLKTILVRERLLITLRRLIRRSRRHCANFQDILRWEAKFRQWYGKPPPDKINRATRSARKTLHTGQQELRVVLAHLRAISFDTVKAVIEWRATFVAPQRPGSEHDRGNGSDRSLHPTVPLQAEPEEAFARDSLLVCHHDQGYIERHVNQNNVPHEGYQVEERKKGEARGNLNYTDDNNKLVDGRNMDPSTAKANSRSSIHISSDGSSSNISCVPDAIFLWKGHNYLVKMAHDLEFLDDASVADPLSGWLGFSVQGNPFLIPPQGHDVCESLQQERKKRLEGTAMRRRQRQQQEQQQHRHRGSGNVQRRHSRDHSRDHPRSHSRSRAHSGSNSRRGTSEGCDFFEPSLCRRQSGVEPLNDSGIFSDFRDDVVSPARLEASELRTGGLTTEMTGGADVTGGGKGGDIFVTQCQVALADCRTDSTSTSIESPPLPGLGEIEDEGIPCQLSSGEEEEVRWSGGGHLIVPIIPDLPEAVRSKAAAAEAVLRSEAATVQRLEFSARQRITNTKRTQEILRNPGQEHYVRMASLAQRSLQEGMRDALLNRHVGATRLKTAASTAEVVYTKENPIGRRVSTAPARGSGVLILPGRSWDVDDFMQSTAHGQRNQKEFRATTGSSRGGVRISADGHLEPLQAEEYGNRKWSTSIPSALSHLGARCSTTPARRRIAGEHSTSHCRRSHQSLRKGGSEETSESASVTSPAEWSLAGSSSLQASTSSQSSRARARAMAIRPTARRPFWRNGGKIIILDPGRSPEVRNRAATLIQSVLLGVCTRNYVRRLRSDRERATRLIGRSWRKSRVRIAMQIAKRMKRAQELRQMAEARSRNRAAHHLQTFFRDIKYRRKRDRLATAQRDRERIARELRERGATVMIQTLIRGFIASRRANKMSFARREQAQTVIARAMRERATGRRQKEREEQVRAKEQKSAIALMRRKKSLTTEEAATRLQAWLRGMHSRRAAPVVRERGTKRAHLQAALDALQAAHAAIKKAGNGERRNENDVQDAPKNAEERNQRGRKGTHDANLADGLSDTSPRAEELEWEARVSERRNTPSRVRTAHDR